MRVVHVINSLSGSGGAEQGLVREIGAMGMVDHHVVSLYEEGPLAERLDALGIPHDTLGFDSGSSGWNWWAGSRELGRRLGALEPDLVHTSLFSGNLVGQLATDASTPVVSTFTLSGSEDLLRRYQPGAASVKAGLLRSVAGVAARRSNALFRALTAHTLETNAKLLGVDPSRCFVIPRGVAVPETLPEVSAEELGLPSGVPILINVGRQAAQKGHADLIRAFAAIRREVECHLVILGRNGDASDELSAAIETHDLQAHATIVDYTDRVLDYLTVASVFVFTSLMEGLGTAVIEAMASRTPVVAYDIPPVREVTDDGRVARLTPVGDIGAFSRAVLEILHDGGSDMASSARSWVDTRYDLDSVAQDLLALFQRAVDEKSGESARL